MASLYIFDIAPYDGAGGLTHYATTWEIIDDSNTVLLLEDKSTEYITVWPVVLDIPSNKLYKVRALRHFKDSNGNEVPNDVYEGPKPILSNKTTLNEPIKPLLYIDRPIIKKAEMDPVDIDKLTIELSESDSNVPIDYTIWNIVADNGDEIYVNTKDTVNRFNLTIDNLNIADIDELYITVAYGSDAGVRSPIVKYTVPVAGGDIALDLKNPVIETTREEVIKVYSPTGKDFTITDAYITDTSGLVLTLCDIDGNTVIIPASTLPAGDTVVLNIKVRYVDSTGRIVYKDIRKTLMTNQPTEYTIFDPDFTYDEKVKAVSGDISSLDIRVNLPGNSEQTTIGFIPFINSDNKFTPTFITDLDPVTLIPKVNNYTFESGISTYGFDYLPNGKLFHIYNNPDDPNESKIMLYDLNYLTQDIVRMSYSTTRLIRSYNISGKNYFTLGNYFYVYGPHTTYRGLTLFRVDLDSFALTTPIYNKIFDDNPADSYAVKPIDYNMLLIIPGNDSLYGYFYDINKNDFTIGPSIPTDMRNKRLKSFSLGNGDIVFFNDQPDANSFNKYWIYKKADNKIAEYYTYDKHFQFAINLRANKILLIAEDKSLYLFG